MSMLPRYTALCLALLAAVALPVSDARAQGQPGQKDGSPAAAPAHKIPDSFKLNMMIRSTVIAVNQANQTNNYTVLRDLGSPRFREANSADKLKTVFESLRKTKFDLSPVLFFTPKLLQPPGLMGDGMLRLTGFFDTVPQRVLFDLLFEDVKGEWLIYGINIATQPSPANAVPEAAPPQSNAPESK